jgi:hypothetical protein
MAFTPGGITDFGFGLNTTEVINELSFVFRVEQMPASTERYYWAFQFLLEDGQGKSQGGYFGFQNNGNLISQNDVGGVVNFALWDATSGRAGVNGEAGPFGGEGVGFRTPSRFQFQAGREYQANLQKNFDSVSLYITDMFTAETQFIGSIKSFSGMSISKNFVTFSEVYTDIPSASSMRRSEVRWSNFTVNGLKADIVAPDMFFQDERVSQNGVIWAYSTSEDVIAAMSGGSSNSIVRGTGGADTIKVSNQGASINGLGGNDLIEGGAGRDIINGGAGSDILIGKSGHDVYVVDNINDKVFETTTQFSKTDAGGNDTIKTWVSQDLNSHTGVQFIERVILLGSNDLNCLGNDRANTISGNIGNNILEGRRGSDIISGDEGDDVLIGGLGRDRLSGGDGADAFVFNTKPNATSNLDSITDFSRAEGDGIRLSKAVFAGFGYTGTLLAENFYAAAGATKAQDATDRIVYNTTTGVLYYDADGLGGTAAVAVAQLGASTHPALVFGDLQIIA